MSSSGNLSSNKTMMWKSKFFPDYQFTQDMRFNYEQHYQAN